MQNPYACDDCARFTSGRCWKHSASQIEMLAELQHVHEWRFVTTLADGQVLVLCPHHEPPETRRLQP